MSSNPNTRRNFSLQYKARKKGFNKVNVLDLILSTFRKNLTRDRKLGLQVDVIFVENFNT